ETDRAVPRSLRVSAAYAWRLLLIAAAAGVIIWIVIQLKLLVIPLLVGILITALLWPVFEWMLRKHVPRWLAIVVALIGTIAIVSGLMWLVGWQVAREWPKVQERTTAAIEELRQYLIDGPLHLTETQIQGYLDQGWELIQQQASLLWSGALAIGSTAGHVVVGALLTLFILSCLLADGGGIRRWTTKLFPRDARPAVDA